ncbi:MAG: hypothetical protein Q7W55_10055 [Pseudohongiella sp.]|nr:hypothetical protein [Pseudohongiella sp.]MDO9519802.1 hypothetical protein [Pseudohongiella sp.]MDP2126232.1 hypothetical protein [Pseudohongiella sp.]
MPKAILALRSYPLAILMALVLFLCSLILATSSTGIIGGDDSGSGMGGTGKSGLPGDSGFGGTGGPRPFWGDAGASSDEQQDNAENQQDPAGWPAPWLQRETETAQIPAEIAPLIDLQRNPLRDPTLEAAPAFPDNPDVLRIIEQDTSQLPLHLRRELELANSGEEMIESSPIEIRLQIPAISAPDPVDVPALQRQLETQQALFAEPTVSEPEADAALPGEAETISQQSGNNSVAENGNGEIPEILTETPQAVDPRATTERIQRPELPPFQRMRPAVDRTSVLPARPQPMRI